MNRKQRKPGANSAGTCQPSVEPPGSIPLRLCFSKPQLLSSSGYDGAQTSPYSPGPSRELNETVQAQGPAQSRSSTQKLKCLLSTHWASTG